MNGTEMIAAERQRQIEVEGFYAAHDDGYGQHELAWAAVCYAAPMPVFRMHEMLDAGGFMFEDPWPDWWDRKYDKRPMVETNESSTAFISADEQPTDVRVRCLAKAGALIAAEIDRLLRMQERS